MLLWFKYVPVRSEAGVIRRSVFVAGIDCGRYVLETVGSISKPFVK